MVARNQTVAVSIAVLVFCASSYAQQELIGTYQGSYKFPLQRHKPQTDMVTLEITSVDNGTVAGKLKAEGQDCPGDYSISGKYENGKFQLQRSAGIIHGCGNDELVLNAGGGKLVGRIGTYHIEVSK
jgi:hypothetical protein